MMKARSLALASTAALTVVAFAADTKVPLGITYPKPAFNGTPQPFKVPNLDPLQTQAPRFFVSPDTRLLSRGKPVTSSDPVPVIGEHGFVTDGDKSGVDGTVVELGPGVQWVQIDLESPARVDAIALWLFHFEPRVYHDVIVQVCDEPSFRRPTVIFNNDHDNSSKLGPGRDRGYIESRFGRLIDAKGVSGRYVRIYSNGNTSNELNHYCEVEVYGTPAR